MYKTPEYDMYEFIDDGVHKSIYTILNEYHPQLKRDFSLANLINHMTEFDSNPEQKQGFAKTYEKDFEKLAKLLIEKTSTLNVSEGDARLSTDELNRIFDELKEASKDNPDCKFFSTIKEYIEYANRTVSVPENKPLRDVVVNNAVPFISRDEIEFTRAVILKTIYLGKAEEKVREVNHKSREPGQYPEWDRLVAIRQILQKKNGLKEYDEFYDEATTQIRTEALKAMEKARVSTVCKMKRAKEVKKGLAPTLEATSKDGRVLELSELFDKLKRIPQKNENAWAYESFRNPELFCDLEANYSENGIENQRVIAFRYGRLKYQNTADAMGGFNIDRTAEMPELVGVSRIGKDGTKTYFVLMPPMDRLTFKPLGEKSQDPGDKPYGFTITQDVEVPTRSGGTRIKRQTTSAELVDGKTGEKLTAYRNREIPEHLKEFFAKVYFSDEYLSQAIEHNARYIGTVVETDNGPQIRTSDVGKANLVAAHYAVYHPGTVDRITTPSFERYCSGSELEIRQYNLINDLERKKAKEKDKTPKSDEPR